MPREGVLAPGVLATKERVHHDGPESKAILLRGTRGHLGHGIAGGRTGLMGVLGVLGHQGNCMGILSELQRARDIGKSGCWRSPGGPQVLGLLLPPWNLPGSGGNGRDGREGRVQLIWSCPPRGGAGCPL